MKYNEEQSAPIETIKIPPLNRRLCFIVNEENNSEKLTYLKPIKAKEKETETLVSKQSTTHGQHIER
jgi:hypothetical protein